MRFIHDDGGRAEAGYKGSAGDCAVRAICIATGRPYQEVYDRINELAKRERKGKRKRDASSARNGVYGETVRRLMAEFGWVWVPTMYVGQGCKVHLHDGELPAGRLVVVVSKHYTAVIDGVVHDTHNPQRTTLITEDGVTRVARRCVYGYFRAENPCPPPN